MLGADENNVDMSPQARTDEIFAKMDENKDGVLSRDEFMRGCMADKQLYSMLLADEPAEWSTIGIDESVTCANVTRGLLANQLYYT